jgi:hypothetical protein
MNPCIECEARLASHRERIARAERLGWLASSSKVNRRRSGPVATAAAILAWVPSRAGAAVAVLSRWLTGGERVAEVG